MKLAIVTAHCGADTLSECLLSWTNGYQDTPVFVVDGRMGMLDAYRRGAEMAKGYDLIAFFHDDMRIILPSSERAIPPNWLHRVLHEFGVADVGLLGFGGGLGHGTRTLYKEPYQYEQLARQDFLSNMEDAENHGRRYEGSCDVAVLDGFAMIVRREVLDKSGNWFKDTAISYIAYDYALSCLTRRLGYRIRLLGVPCQHYGGRSFVKLKIGNSSDHWTQYLAAHKYVATEFKDVLPYRVQR